MARRGGPPQVGPMGEKKKPEKRMGYSLILFVFCLFLVIILVIRRCVRKYFFRRKSLKIFGKLKELSLLLDEEEEEIDEDKLIKTPYLENREKVVEQEYDCIIIGSGMSGMTVAGVLSQCGKKVLVLEQHETLGGMTNTWEEEGVEFPSGLHFLTNSCRQRSLRLILDQLTEGQLEFKDFPDPFNTIFVDGKEYKVYVSQREYLKKTFPKEKKRIDRYFDLVERLQFKELDILMYLRPLPKLIRCVAIFILQNIFCFKMFKYNDMSIEETLNEFGFQDDHLRKIVSYYHILSGDYTRLSSLFNLSLCAALCLNSRDVVTNEILGGKSQIVGGSGMIAKKVFRTAKKFGCEFYTLAEVKSVIIDDDKSPSVRGVQLTNGDVIRSNRVVSTIGLINTYKLLSRSKNVPTKIKRIAKNIDTRIQSSVQHFCVFVAFDGSPEELKIPPNDIIIVNRDFSTEYDTDSDDDEEEKEPHMIFIGNVNHITPVVKNGRPKTVLTLIVISTWEKFVAWKDTKIKQRGSDYEELKDQIIERVLRSFYKHYPSTEGRLDVCIGGSPLSSKHWTFQPRGESYGMLHDRHRIFKTYDTFVKNILEGKKKAVKGFYFSGMDQYICAGVSSAAYSGLMTSNEVMGGNLIMDDFNAYKKKIRRELVQQYKDGKKDL